MQGYARLCKVMQGYARLCKVNYGLILYILVLKLEDGLEGTQWLLKATGMLDHEQVSRFLQRN